MESCVTKKFEYISQKYNYYHECNTHLQRG